MVRECLKWSNDCGGFRCSGADYAEIIKEFDVADYKISNFEVIEETETLGQIIN